MRRILGQAWFLPAAAVLAPVAVGGLLVPARGHLSAANSALILVVAVVAVATAGSRGAAAVTAIAAAVSFDFFLVPPYYSLRITHRDDLITDFLLLVVGLAVGDLAARGRAHRSHADQRLDEVETLHAITELVATGEDHRFVTIAAATELRTLLSLRDCRFSRTQPEAGATRIAPDGSVLIGDIPWATWTFGLPTREVDLPVRHRGWGLGHFALIPTPAFPVSRERLLVAVAIADQVGAAMAADDDRAGGSEPATPDPPSTVAPERHDDSPV
jgi:Domain of unknown function (DUF4118)